MNSYVNKDLKTVEGFKLATYPLRFAASFVDMAVCSLIGVVIYYLCFNVFTNISEISNLTSKVLLLITLFIPTLFSYLVIPLIFKNGQTLGKKLFNLKLFERNAPYIRWWRIVLRYLTLLVLVILFSFIDNFLIPFFIALGLFVISTVLTFLTPYRQSLHDLIACCVVGRD